MKVDHKQTETALDNVAREIRHLKELLNKYYEDTAPKEEDEKYKIGYVKGLHKAFLDKLKEDAQGDIEYFERQVESMKECEEANEGAIDFTDPTLQGILSAIDAFQDKELLITNTGDGGELYKELSGSGRIVEAALEELRGQRNALELVKNKLESKGYKIEKRFEKYFYSLEMFNELESSLTALCFNPTTGIYYFKAKSAVTRVADVFGFTLPDMAVAGVDEEIMRDVICAAAGAN